MTIGGSSRSVYQLSKRFKEKWQFIDISNFKSASTDPSVEPMVAIKRFQTPGAMHHARWIGKVLYAIKKWLLSDQFKFTKSKSKVAVTWPHSLS